MVLRTSEDYLKADATLGQLRNARKVPELKGEPINSMAVLDRVYKHIGGLEQEAQRTLVDHQADLAALAVDHHANETASANTQTQMALNHHATMAGHAASAARQDANRGAKPGSQP